MIHALPRTLSSRASFLQDTVALCKSFGVEFLGILGFQLRICTCGPGAHTAWRFTLAASLVFSCCGDGAAAPGFSRSRLFAVDTLRCALLPCFPQSGFRFDCGHDDVCDGFLARDLLLMATVPFAGPPRPVLSMWPETVSPSYQLVVRSASSHIVFKGMLRGFLEAFHQ